MKIVYVMFYHNIKLLKILLLNENANITRSIMLQSRDETVR